MESGVECISVLKLNLIRGGKPPPLIS